MKTTSEINYIIQTNYQYLKIIKKRTKINKFYLTGRIESI